MPTATPPPPTDTHDDSHDAHGDGPTPAHAPAAPQDRNRFLSWLRGLGLVRQQGWIGGVATGIADRLGIDPLIVRGILVVVAVVGAPATLLYAIAWALLPDAKGKIHLEELVRGRFDTPMIGIAVLLAVSLLPVPQGIWSLGAAYWGQPYWGDSIGRAVWTLVLIGLVIWLMVWFIRRNNRAQFIASASPASTDDRPDVTATPASDAAASDAAATTAPTLAYTGTILGTPGTEAPTTPVAPVAPSRPADGASSEELAAWRDGQAAWKLQYDAYREQRSAERQAASAAAAQQARVERMARSAAYREQRARTRSHPLYSVVLIGVALVVGAITVLAIGGSQPSVLQYLTGIGVAIAVLGVGIVINGIRGKRSGGASAVAVLLAIPLLLTAIFPQSSSLHYSGDWTVRPVAASGGWSQNFFAGTAKTTLDLRSFYSGSTSSTTDPVYGSVELFVASGDVTVIMPPTDGKTDVATMNVETGSGAIVTDTGVDLAGDGHHSWGTSSSFVADDPGPARQLYVRVLAGSGTITVVNAPQDSE